MHHMNMTHFLILEIIVGALALAALVLYPAAMYASGKKHQKWKWSRYTLFAAGVTLSAAALTGPLARLSHMDFTVHMLGHLLIGMLGPLLILHGKPMTLLMRTLKVAHARKLSKILNLKYVQFISNPIVASILNIGGLFLIHKTGLFEIMHSSVLLFALIHLHVFLAGYLFTMSIIYIDIVTHRYTFLYRAAVLIAALGFHKILSKMIYASPPAGIAREDGEAGAMLMYYGGDIVDLALIIILCWQWYKTAEREHTRLLKFS